MTSCWEIAMRVAKEHTNEKGVLDREAASRAYQAAVYGEEAAKVTDSYRQRKMSLCELGLVLRKSSCSGS